MAKTIKEKRITRTIHMANVTVTVYNKVTKEVEEKQDVIPYHGEDILELAKALPWLTVDDRVIDAEIDGEADVLWSISEHDFMAFGKVES